MAAGAASTRVGNELGRGAATSARRAAFTVVALELALIAVVTGALFAMQRLWAALFTHEAEVRRLFASVFALVLFSEFGDGLNCVCGGIMRGAGRQLIATGSNALVYWAGCLPLAVFLAPRLGVAGLWLALAAATTLQGLVMLLCVAALDWRREAAKASLAAGGLLRTAEEAPVLRRQGRQQHAEQHCLGLAWRVPVITARGAAPQQPGPRASLELH